MDTRAKPSGYGDRQSRGTVQEWYEPAEEVRLTGLERESGGSGTDPKVRDGWSLQDHL